MKCEPQGTFSIKSMKAKYFGAFVFAGRVRSLLSTLADTVAAFTVWLVRIY